MITKPTIYTEELVKKELADILAEILENKDIVLLGEVFEKKAYPREYFSRWEKEHKDNNEICHTIRKIKNLLEDRVNLGGLKNKLNSAMTKFNLINNYEWKDKSETDITSGGEKLNPVLVKFIDGKDNNNRATAGVQEAL